MLQNKIALIMNATTPFASAVARIFAYEKSHVVLVDEDMQKLASLEKEIIFLKGKVTTITMNFSNTDTVGILTSNLESTFNKLDILVSSAGTMTELKLLTDFHHNEWLNIINTGIIFHWTLLRSLDKLLKRSGNGRVIFGIIGDIPDQLHSPYIVVNNALKSLLHCYALENKHSSVKANIISLSKDQLSEQDENTQTSELLAEMFLDLASPKIKTTGQIYHPIL
ncbi:MAG: hypothetical protein P857_331 [Candidatus Xenolissoclinum pacificiensis L6]|uniref:Short chain dehydrogenase family protein n=1 Tax=Candidatus Xenolissoclinum pacificiensis L6 TaxID=1401685 RepID=W2UZ46_9RICK|nr:MAG: hypothetical protein P857_331 [Candidatus Xenolissoclinum pacificiensis L6]